MPFVTYVPSSTSTSTTRPDAVLLMTADCVPSMLPVNVTGSETSRVAARCTVTTSGVSSTVASSCANQSRQTRARENRAITTPTTSFFFAICSTPQN